MKHVNSSILIIALVYLNYSSSLNSYLMISNDYGGILDLMVCYVCFSDRSKNQSSQALKTKIFKGEIENYRVRTCPEKNVALIFTDRNYQDYSIDLVLLSEEELLEENVALLSGDNVEHIIGYSCSLIDFLDFNNVLYLDKPTQSIQILSISLLRQKLMGQMDLEQGFNELPKQIVYMDEDDKFDYLVSSTDKKFIFVINSDSGVFRILHYNQEENILEDPFDGQDFECEDIQQINELSHLKGTSLYIGFLLADINLSVRPASNMIYEAILIDSRNGEFNRIHLGDDGPYTSACVIGNAVYLTTASFRVQKREFSFL